MEFPTSISSYPAKHQILDYFNDYITKFNLNKNVSYGSAVNNAHFCKESKKWIIETKGAESLNDPRKFARLKEWCLDASKSEETPWKCLYLRQEIWDSFKVKPDSFQQLVDFLSLD